MNGPAKGALYGSDSLAWRVNKNWMPLLGGLRAVIMQIAEPRIASAVAEHSAFRTDPLGRLERTMDSMMVIGFASPERRQKTLDHIEEVHKGIKGRTEDGDPYSALNPRLMYWVLATITDTVYEIDRRYVGMLNERDREAYFDETRAIANAFGIDDRYIPDSLADFREYVSQQVEDIVPSDTSREVARALLQPGIRFIPNIALMPLDWITLELLPTTMRQRLHLGSLSPVQLAAVRGARQVARTAMPVLPTPLKLNPFTVRALRRVA